MIVGESRFPWTPMKGAGSEPSFEADVVPVESQELAAAEAGVGEESEQEPVAFALAGEVTLPDVVVLGRRKQPRHLAPVEHVRQYLSLLRCAQHECGIAVEGLVLDAEAEEALQRRDRPRLTSERRPALRLGGEEAAQVGRAHQAQILDSALVQKAHAGGQHRARRPRR
jgi:hypothetical protein